MSKDAGARNQAQIPALHYSSHFVIQNSASSHDHLDISLHRTQHLTCALVSVTRRPLLIHALR